MLDCQHDKIAPSSVVEISARGYHDCPVLVCLDCDDSMHTGCDDETCTHY